MRHAICLALICCALILQSAGAMIPVSKSGDNVTTYTTISAALAAAAAGEEVRITDQQNYEETITLENVRLTSVPPGAVISGTSPAGNRLIHVIGTAPVEISGLSVYVFTAGHGIQIEAAEVPQVTLNQCEVVAPWAGVQLFVASGNGITDLQATGLRLHDCSIGLDAQGGGNGGFSATIDGNSDIFNNWEAGIRFLLGGTLTLNQVRVATTGNGPGVFLPAAGETTLEATDCSFVNNLTDGMLGVVNPTAASGSTWTLTRCTLTGNGQSAVQIYSNENQGVSFSAERTLFAQVGASTEPLVDLFKANATLVNCVLNHGAAAHQLLLRYAGGEHASVRHCTFVSTDPNCNSISLIDGGTAEVTNCIVEAAGASLNVYPAVGPLMTHDYNLLRGQLNNVTTGTHELVAVDPIFVTPSTGPGTGDFRLRPNSPAVGAATALTPAVTVDFLGATRTNPATLGAYDTPTTVTASRHWTRFE